MTMNNLHFWSGQTFTFRTFNSKLKSRYDINKTFLDCCDFLHYFNNIFKSLWFKEVFGDVNMVENMIEILLDVSLSLDPDLNFCLNAGLKQQSERLEYLLSVKKNFNDFLSHLDRLLLDNTHGKY